MESNVGININIYKYYEIITEMKVKEKNVRKLMSDKFFVCFVN